MHLALNRLRVLGLVPLVAFCMATAGCAPIVFQDDTALAIAGDPPSLPPEPEPEPEPPKRVEVRDNKIVINEKIQFEVNKAAILPESDSLLAEIAQVIKDNPHIKKLQIEGHASSDGNDKKNVKLSKRRAKAVMDHLVKNGGIAKETLVSEGFGETRPIADNETEEGRIKNRRVEFMITEQEVTKKKVEVDPETGREKVISEEKESPAKAAKPATAKPTTAKPATAKPATAKPATAKPATAKPATAAKAGKK